MAAMMRARMTGGPCRVPGHGTRCEVFLDRGLRDRAQEKREWRREVGREVAS